MLLSLHSGLRYARGPARSPAVSGARGVGTQPSSTFTGRPHTYALMNGCNQAQAIGSKLGIRHTRPHYCSSTTPGRIRYSDRACRQQKL